MKRLLSLSVLFCALSCIGSILHAQGNFIWAKQVSRTDANTEISVKSDAAGNVYLMGSFPGTVDFDPGADVFNMVSTGNDDIYITKLDSAGSFIWTKQLGGTDSDRGVAMFVDEAGNVYTTGFFFGTADFDPGVGVFNLTTSVQDIFISKLDTDGNFVWAKQLAGLSSPHYNQGTDITVDDAGNVYTTGIFEGTVDFDPGVVIDTISAGSPYPVKDVFISKLDADGNFVWVKNLAGDNSHISSAIVTDRSGNVITTGSYSGTMDFDPGASVYTITGAGTEANTNAFISKINADGDFVWAKSLGGDAGCIPTDLAIDTSGNSYVYGTYSGTADFNPGPGVYNLTELGSGDIFISKLDSDGNFAWAKSMGGSDWDNPTSIVVDHTSNVYTTGFFTGMADFDPDTDSTATFTATGFANLFVSKLNDAGGYVWTKSMGGATGAEYGFGTSLVTDGRTTYVAGIFMGTNDFDPGETSFDVTPLDPDAIDVFVLKLQDTLAVIIDTVIIDTISHVGITGQSGRGTNNFNVYPNPNTGEFNVRMNLDVDSKLIIDMYDVTGQVIKTISPLKLNAGNSVIKIDALELPPGIYFVKIHSETISKALKFLINK